MTLLAEYLAFFVVDLEFFVLFNAPYDFFVPYICYGGGQTLYPSLLTGNISGKIS